MFSTSKENQIISGNAKIDSVYHSAEWFIAAFAGTLVFITFIMQVYRIPTGSMAETLRGAHFRVQCGQCGYRYDHDFYSDHYGMANTANPSQKLPIIPRSPRCPTCGYTEPKPIRSHDGRYFTYKDDKTIPAYARTVFKGDQIFVLKSIYQFFEPKRWDVIVFKKPVIDDPRRPQDNYIKRCIGLPGEMLQIIDGDIFINGLIQRTPKKVQEELWMVIYDNNFQPARPEEKSFNGHTWKQPFENVGTSKWDLSADGPTVFRLNSNNKMIHRIQYNDTQGNNFKATYAYDDPKSFQFMPICSDLMIQYHVMMHAESATGGQIQKNGVIYQGWLYSDGKMEIDRLTPGGQPIAIAEGTCLKADLNAMTRFRFAVVDQQLVLKFGSSELSFDLGTEIDAAGTKRQLNPHVQILGTGKLELRHIGVYRDIYYLSSDEDRRVQRASRDNPMVLREGEYFACGDNSPFSADSRIWNVKGTKNNDGTYPAGVVPKDYLVGKAFIVHWPGGYRLKQEPIRWIPFPDGMKIIYGGKD